MISGVLTFLIIARLGQAVSPPPQFQCQPSSENGHQVFPNIPDSYFDPANAHDFLRGSDATLETSMAEVTYVFRIPAMQHNCSGSVVSLQYCYETVPGTHTDLDTGTGIGSALGDSELTPDNPDCSGDYATSRDSSPGNSAPDITSASHPRPRSIFTFLSIVMIKVGREISFERIPEFNVSSSPCDGCMDNICCGTTRLPDNKLRLPDNQLRPSFGFAFGVRTTSSGNIVAFRNSTYFRAMQLLQTGSISNYPLDNMRFGINSLLLLRFLINPKNPPITRPSTNVPPSLASPPISEISQPPSFNAAAVGGAVGGIIVTIALVVGVVIAVICMVLVLGKRGAKEEHRMQEQQGVAIGVCAYEEVDDGTMAPREYSCIGPEVGEVIDFASQQPHAQPTESRDEDIYVVPAKDENALYAQLGDITTLHLPRSFVKLGALLGSGQFGTVHKGVLESGGGEVEVAVKTLKEGSGEEDRVKFLQEAAIMAQFKHHNVVTMYGVVTQGEPILLVLELLGKGDLRDNLLHMRLDEEGVVSVDGHTLLSYCRQVASGMAYLSSKAFVHRDLAARNILVSQDEICKIADFGMSRDLMDESYYVSHGGMIPVKWTAPEALHYKKYSTASDVWSYGVLVYEIWSLGHKPFEGYVNNKVMRVVDTGYRLPPPPGCPRALYTIMMSCWHPVASERLSFLDITQQLSLPDTKLLKWSEEDKSVHPEAARLGADLLCGEELYKDLQTRYQE